MENQNELIVDVLEKEFGIDAKVNPDSKGKVEFQHKASNGKIEKISMEIKKIKTENYNVWENVFFYSLSLDSSFMYGVGIPIAREFTRDEVIDVLIRDVHLEKVRQRQMSIFDY